MKKVAFITGAAGGIGQAIAENLVSQNYRIALADIAKDKLIEHTKILKHKYQLQQQDEPIIFAIDVSDPAQVNAAVNSLMRQVNRIDILFNGVGIARLGGSEIDFNEFEKIVKVNLLGHFNCIHEIVPIMKKQASGYIFNVASRQGKMAGSNLAAYASSKFAVVGLSESILKELINTGIKVTALCPSYTNTSMMDLLDFPKEEMLEPDDLVKTVNYLLSLSAPACIREVLIEIRKLV